MSMIADKINREDKKREKEEEGRTAFTIHLREREGGGDPRWTIQSASSPSHNQKHFPLLKSSSK